MGQEVRTIILAGGQGTRFWPISRMKCPKQFLSISPSGESLIAATARRAGFLCGPENLWIVTNIQHRAAVLEHVPHAHVLCESVGRNTAASIGLAAISLRHRSEDAVMVVLPADHAIKDEATLTRVLQGGVSIAQEKGRLVTIGITPTHPHTGYGYIRRGEKLAGCGPNAFEVSRFYEKPNLNRAIKYVESGDFFWNSGMFVWRATTILEAFKEYMPDLYAGLCRIELALGGPQESATIAEEFAKLESVSIDFGVLEHARNCAVIVAEPFGWDDVGSWESWAEHFEKDERNNLCYGDVIVLDGTNNVVHSKTKFIATLGVSDLVIIDAGDAMLVCPRSRAQDVRKVVEELRRVGRKELV